MHGGISLAAAVQYGSVEEMNAAYHSMQEVQVQGILGNEGPLWYRGYARKSDDRTCTELRKVLDLLGASYMVMGHTVQERIRFPCNKAVLVDTGISNAMFGRASAVEILQRAGVTVRMKALYEDREEVLFDVVEIRQ